MSHSLIRLLYISSPSSKFPPAEIEKILSVARTHNAKEGITGVLWCGAGHFVQALEGPPEAVLKLYLKICQDPRHKDCHLVQASLAGRRLFSGWSMGYLQESTGARLNASEIEELQCHDDTGIEVLRKMRNLLKKIENAPVEDQEIALTA